VGRWIGWQRPVTVTVERIRGASVTRHVLQLVPARWSGRGLLGYGRCLLVQRHRLPFTYARPLAAL